MLALDGPWLLGFCVVGGRISPVYGASYGKETLSKWHKILPELHHDVLTACRYDSRVLLWHGSNRRVPPLVDSRYKTLRNNWDLHYK